MCRGKCDQERWYTEVLKNDRRRADYEIENFFLPYAIKLAR